jgi:hypothetical protein
VAALVAALGVGGVAVAQSGTSTQPPAASQQSTAPENTATDTDNVQSGDQTSPDPAGGAAEKESATEKPGAEGPEVPGDDGPGGHADEPANPNAAN